MRSGGQRVDNGPDSVHCDVSTSLCGENAYDGRRLWKGSSVEVKIGVTDSPRELSFNSAQTPTEVEKEITDALAKDSGVLALTDEKGRRFLVQAARSAYLAL